MGLVAQTETDGLVDVVPGSGAGGGEFLGDLFEVFDLEADMMDTGPVLAPLGAGDLVVLEIKNRQVDRPVGQKRARHDRRLDFGDLGQAKRFNIKLGRLLGVLGRNCNMSDLCHRASPIVIFIWRLLERVPVSELAGAGSR